MTTRPLSPLTSTSRRGFRRCGDQNLIGYAIAAALTVAAVVGIVALGQNTRDTAFADSECDKLISLKENIASTFGGRFTNLGNPLSGANLSTSGLPPTSMVVGATVVNGRNGAVSVVGAPGGVTTQFTITSLAHTQTDCLGIAARMSKDTSVVSIAVAGGSTMTRAGGQFPLTGANLTTLCSTANEDITITFSP